MSRTITREPFVKQSVSLRRDQLAGLRRVVVDDGHANLSRVIQKLVEDELRSRYGRDWAAEVVVNAADTEQVPA